MSQRQTVSFLKRRFEAAGLRPDRRRGQNFLVDLNLIQLIADASRIRSDEVALEIGTGLGSLTAILAKRACAVVTVEVDRRLQQLAAEQLFDLENVVMLSQDALRNKNNLDPRVMSAVCGEIEKRTAAGFRFIANLPYNIATPVISNLLSAVPLPVSMTVTIQRELADRITAKPGSKDYGAVSVWVQSQCSTSIVRTMPPAVFWPRPKVHSAILHIEPSAVMRARIRDPEFLKSFARSLFSHRRKLLRAGLMNACGGVLSATEIDGLLATSGIDPRTRAESLSVDAIVSLSEGVQRRMTESLAKSNPTRRRAE